MLLFVYFCNSDAISKCLEGSICIPVTQTSIINSTRKDEGIMISFLSCCKLFDCLIVMTTGTIVSLVM